MTQTVTLVQLADLYEVQKLIREANNCAKAAKALAETKSVAGGFVQNVTDYVQSAAEAARQVVRFVTKCSTDRIDFGRGQNQCDPLNIWLRITVSTLISTQQHRKVDIEEHNYKQ